MSHPSRVLSWDASTAASRGRQRSPSLTKTDPVPDPTDPSEDPSEWSTRLQPRRSLALRLALSRKAAAENKALQRRESLLQGGPDGAMRRLEGEGDDELAPEIQAAIMQDRSAIDGRRSIRALRIWDSVARRLEEGASAFVESPDPSSASEVSASVSGGSGMSSQRSSSYGAMPRSTPHRRDTVGRTERRSRIRGSTYDPPSEASSRRGSEGQRGLACGTPSEAKLYPCPFRRRNPMRFNIRDHEHCARMQFSAIVDLRHHIIVHHQRRRPHHQCRRCGLEFDTQAALDDHLMMPKDQICEIISVQPNGDIEDGISEDIERALATSGDPVDEWDWALVWRLVFPTDKDVPDPDFHPVVELVEVEQALDEGQEALKTSLQDKLRLLLPNTIEDSYCTFLSGQLELVVETHNANIMRQCLTKLNSPASQPVSAAITTKQANTKPQGSIVRRSTRRSRRSTILPTRSGSTSDAVPDVAKEVAFIQLRPRLLEKATPQPIADESLSILPPSGTTLFTNISLSPSPLDTTTTPSPGRDEYSSPRESRDSGIGIPCDVCESETCRCREIILPLASAGKTSPRSVASTAPRSPPPPPKDTAPAPMPQVAEVYIPIASVSSQGNVHRQSQIPLAVQSRAPQSLRHQPKLRVKTTNIGLGVSAAESADGFSPQSFKQRVLRTQGVRYPERGDWTV